ncbi:ABC transporter permease [Ferrimonas pelagia]|uniref:FtsX-like permease family protein n=1 Tax=Ferrimonas pelagia TaxID=1177826 RepID=A0ABP9EMF3_9GAMM
MFELRPILSALLRSKSAPLLIIAQLALTLAVIANAAFIVQERLTTLNRDSGVTESELLSFTVIEMDTQGDLMPQRRRDEQLLRQIPGVISASATNQIPLSNSGSSSTVSSLPDDQGNSVNVGYYMGNESLFDTLGISLVAGRAFNPTDISVDSTMGTRPDQALISQYTADILFPDESALGKLVYMQNHPIEVIGIMDTLQSPWPHRQDSYASAIIPVETPMFIARFMVRVEADAMDSVLNAVSDVLLADNPDRVITGIRPFAETRDRAYRNDTAMAVLLSVVIVLLLAVTAFGIVGLASYSVSQRQKQIGTRRALGATRLMVLRHFLIENAMICSAGVLLGSFGAIGLNQFLMQNYELSRLPLGYLLVSLTGLVLLGQLSVAAPAYRASTISPAIATRSV